MAERSAIEWCDSTFNPWIGCTKISTACDHCYAEAQMDTRLGRVKWGAGQQRQRTSAANWRQPVRWNARSFWQCDTCGWRGENPHLDGLLDEGAQVRNMCPGCWPALVAVKPARRRVFCASLADVFDNEAPVEWLVDLLELIRKTPNLDWLLLSKRVGNWRSRMKEARLHISSKPTGGECTWSWIDRWEHDEPPPNVWLGATVCNQPEADRDIPKLRAVPARGRFLSIEPMLGPVDLTRIDLGAEWMDSLAGYRWLKGSESDICDAGAPLDQVICGGESGPHARPMHPDWARSLRDQCAAAGVAFNFKQWGDWRPPLDGEEYSTAMGNAQRIPCYIVAPAGTVHCFENGDWTKGGEVMRRVGKRAAGRLLDGQEHNGFPVVTL